MLRIQFLESWSNINNYVAKICNIPWIYSLYAKTGQNMQLHIIHSQVIILGIAQSVSTCCLNTAHSYETYSLKHGHFHIIFSSQQDNNVCAMPYRQRICRIYYIMGLLHHLWAPSDRLLVEVLCDISILQPKFIFSELWTSMNMNIIISKLLIWI